MGKNKFYVVWEGHETGIFKSWADCKRVIDGYASAKYKGFPNLEQAEYAVNQPFYKFIGNNKKPAPSATSASRSGTPIWDSISVDAAYSSSSMMMEYQGVHTQTKQRYFKVGPLPRGTNNVGEFLAIVHALALFKKENINLPIYTDSITAMAWVRNKKAKTTLKEVGVNKKLFDYIQRAEAWLQNNTWQNKILKWDTKNWGEIPADFGRK